MGLGAVLKERESARTKKKKEEEKEEKKEEEKECEYDTGRDWWSVSAIETQKLFFFFIYNL